MDEFTPLELSVMRLLAEGLDAFAVCDWLGIDYKQYLEAKKNILKKLKIKRITQILPVAIYRGFMNF